MWFMLDKGEEPYVIVKKVRATLITRGALALFPHIGHAFERIAERNMRRERSVVSIARKKDEKEARLAADARDAELVIDSSLIGGWRYEDKEVLVDNSFKRHLFAIYNRASR